MSILCDWNTYRDKLRWCTASCSTNKNRPQISMQSKCPQVELTQVVSSAPLAPCCHTIDGVIRTCQAETCHFFFFPPVKGRKLIAHINFHSLKMTFNFAGRKLVGLASTRHCSRNNMSKWSDNAMRTLLFLRAEWLKALIEVLLRFQMSVRKQYVNLCFLK